jgi:hypothetical protein
LEAQRILEIIGLTDKGWQLSRSVRHSADIGWRVIYFLKRMGGKSTLEKIAAYCFSGGYDTARSVVSDLKRKGVVVGE